jgi:hypothetical protein
MPSEGRTSGMFDERRENSFYLSSKKGERFDDFVEVGMIFSKDQMKIGLYRNNHLHPGTRSYISIREVWGKGFAAVQNGLAKEKWTVSTNKRWIVTFSEPSEMSLPCQSLFNRQTLARYRTTYRNTRTWSRHGMKFIIK